MRPIRAVVFDLFGTVVQITNPTYPYANLLAKIGASQEQIPNYKRFVMCNDLGLSEIAVALGGLLPPADLAKIERDLQTELTSIRLYPETLDVIEILRCRGTKVGVAANLAAPYEKPVRALLPEFDAVVLSFKAGAVKPDPTFFTQVIQSVGCAPAEILMVSDNPKNDIAGAKAMGMQALRINRAPGRSESDIGSLWDIAAAVK